MPRIKPVAVDEAKGEVKEIYQAFEKKLGKVINIFQGMGNSAAALKAFVNLDEAAQKTSIPPKLREQIALIVGQANQCQYCLSAHTAIAKGLGINEQDIMKARHASSSDPKTQAILKFARLIVEKRGHLTDNEVADVKAAGVNDHELVEIILLVIVNMYTNYFNLVTDTKVDFPLAPELS